MKKYLFSLGLVLTFAACAPYEDEDIKLPDPPGAPSITVEPIVGAPNRIVIKDVSTGFFARVWDLPGGTPAKSTLAVDTIFYQSKGDYIITMYASAEGGGGAAQVSRSINIAEDAQPACDPQTALLTGDCEGPGKCWTLTNAAGAVRVGPQPGSSEWYTSPVNGLQTAQYDDDFCFYFTAGRFQYFNNGQTVDPFNGYQAVDYTPPTNLSWIVSKGTGQNGADQIILPAGAFLGVWDSGPIYDIASLTEDQLVVRSKIVNTDGWFELTFVKN